MDNIDLLQKLVKKQEELESDSCLLDEIVDDLWDVILDTFKIPKDNTTEFKTMEECEKSGKCFCRDAYYTLLCDFSYGKISKKKLLKKLIEYL